MNVRGPGPIPTVARDPKHAAATRKVGSEGQRHSNGGGTHSSKQGGGWADDRWRGESHGRKIRWEGDQVGGSDGLNGRKDLTQRPASRSFRRGPGSGGENKSSLCREVLLATWSAGGNLVGNIKKNGASGRVAGKSTGLASESARPCHTVGSGDVQGGGLLMAGRQRRGKECWEGVNSWRCD